MIKISFDKNKVLVKGEIDIFCAEQFKNAVKGQKFTENFIIDLTQVQYIDSSGIGVLISLYNYFEKNNIIFHIKSSESVKKIFSISKLDTLFFKNEKEKTKKQNDVIVFYDSFEADTKILSFLIDHLFRDLKKAGYKDEESQEIVVAVDEGITNAIMETIKATGDVEDDLTISFDSKKVKSIAIKWEITKDEFFATIIDHGSGFDINSINASIPEVKKSDYLEQVKKYQDKCNLHLRVNGEEVELKRLGAGLKIMTNFMDAIFIDMIDSEHMVSNEVNDSTLGTILNLYRQRRDKVN